MSGRRRLAAFAALAVVTVGGCSSTDPNSMDAQARAGDHKGYVSGDGSIEKIPVAQRGAPLALAGATVDGRTLDIASWHGKVVVVNLWGSWCPPCVAESPALQKVWKATQDAHQSVEFVGIDTREDPATGAAFLKSRGIGYPSFSDEQGILVLSLQGKATTTPTTLVLDTAGRIAARVGGQIDDVVLEGLIADQLKESPS